MHALIQALNKTFQDGCIDIQHLNNQIRVVSSSYQEKITNLTHFTNYRASRINATLFDINEVTQITLQGLEEQIIASRFLTPINSCSDIPNNTSGYFWTNRTIDGSSFLRKVYCDSTHRNCMCNATSGWMRVAHIDMTDSTHHCPPEFRTVERNEKPFRVCGRPVSYSDCVSTTFPVYGVVYSHVCGRVIGYHVGTPNGFAPSSYLLSLRNIDRSYIEGISITHGTSPRKHVWSFVGALAENLPLYQPPENYHPINVCPCMTDSFNLEDIPSFVGNDYFCDTAQEDANFNATLLYPGDPLWDGEGCGANSTCCQFNNPPWFCKQLPQLTTDDMQLRLCKESRFDDMDNTPFELVEIFVK